MPIYKDHTVPSNKKLIQDDDVPKDTQNLIQEILDLENENPESIKKVKPYGIKEDKSQENHYIS